MWFLFKVGGAVVLCEMSQDQWQVLSTRAEWATTLSACGKSQFRKGHTSRFYSLVIYATKINDFPKAEILCPAFNLGSLETCSTDHLKIYEVDTSNGAETFRSQLCGNVSRLYFC